MLVGALIINVNRNTKSNNRVVILVLIRILNGFYELCRVITY